MGAETNRFWPESYIVEWFPQLRRSFPVPTGVDEFHKVVILEKFCCFPNSLWNRQREERPNITAQSLLFGHQFVFQRLKNTAGMENDHVDENSFFRRNGFFGQIDGGFENARQLRAEKKFLPYFPVICGDGEQIGNPPRFGVRI